MRPVIDYLSAKACNKLDRLKQYDIQENQWWYHQVIKFWKNQQIKKAVYNEETNKSNRVRTIDAFSRTARVPVSELSS